MANPLQKPATTPADKLAHAADEYLREIDNPAPDYLYRHTLRERLRKTLAEYQESKSA
jgi:hypothetical protein